MTEEQFIWITRWPDFQTYQKKRGRPWAPPWIKLYPKLLDDPRFVDLTPQTQALLFKLWMLFARTRGVIRISSNVHEGHAEHSRSTHEALTWDTRNLSRQVGQRVTKQQLETLNHAGWITFCSGTVRERLWNAFWNCSSLEVEVEVEVDKEPVPAPVPEVELPARAPDPAPQTPTVDGAGAGAADDEQIGPHTILQRLRSA